MKKIALTAAVLMLTATAASASLVGTPGKISGSKHDLSGSGGANEICIYCHTPHNAVQNVPLWNRNNPSGGLFSLYNSPTLTSNAKASGFTDKSISLFCMSCHDGQVGLGNVANKNNYTTTVLSSIGPIGTAVNTGLSATSAGLNGGVKQSSENAMLGRDLRSTHPVGFVFPAHSDDTGLNTIADINTAFDTKKESWQTSAQPFLYGDQGTFECASCHRVHDPGVSGNFLRIENQKSQLCLACHNK